MESTVLEQANIEDAKAAIQAYITKCNGYNTTLDTMISTLTAEGADFNGDAADGYLAFYEKVKPAFTSQLLDNEGLMPSLVKILDSIYEALNATMDPNLKNANENAGASA